MHIQKITIIKTSGMDKILFHTDLPPGDTASRDNLALSALVAQNTGENYIKLHFPGIQYTMINI